MIIYLDKYCVDMGYPDPGHYEWALIRKEERKNKILQRIFGDKKTQIKWYGEDKPNEDTVDNDIMDILIKMK